MSAPKASKSELLKLIHQGIEKDDLVIKFGYKNIQSINFTLYSYFGTVSLEKIKANIPFEEEKQKRTGPLDNYWTKYPKFDQRAYSELFNNPIAHCNLLTGEHYNRIEEVWAREGLA